MCTFNGEKYLREQLDSILNQTHPLEELIIQDDCSTDSTLDIIKEYQKENPIIKWFLNEEKKGVNENFFSVMHKAKGDYIAISDQDDIWELDKIEKQVNSIGDHLLCFGNSRFFCDNKTIKSDKEAPNYSLIRFVFLNMISGHAMLINSRLLQLIPFRSDLVLYDYWLGLTAACHNSIVHCNGIICNHRIHNNNQTFKNENVEKKNTPLDVLLSSLKIRKQLKQEAKTFFSSMHSFISQTKVETKETKEAKKIARLMANTSWFSTIRAMMFCLFHRDKVLDHEPSKIMTLIKAPLFPFQCYHFFNF